MRRLAALLLILCLVFCLLPTMSAASGISVCFIAANDNLLELSYQPYWQGSTIYVPYTVFVNFKIYNSFHQSSNTASLYSSTKQLYFNLDSGETYDGNGTYYNVTPISRGGRSMSRSTLSAVSTAELVLHQQQQQLHRRLPHKRRQRHTLQRPVPHRRKAPHGDALQRLRQLQRRLRGLGRGRRLLL